MYGHGGSYSKTFFDCFNVSYYLGKKRNFLSEISFPQLSLNEFFKNGYVSISTERDLSNETIRFRSETVSYNI